MSLKIKGLLNDYQSLREKKIGGSLETYTVPCEMTFEAENAFMSHESPEHQYLPVFHIVGYVTELTGDFGYDVSSIKFGEEDKSKLYQDILYYPTPQELSDMILNGDYFTKKFQIPDILTKNTYSFPVKVEVSVVPPDPSAEHDADRVPLMYVDLKGTGVSKENDKLLAYYGINLESNYPVFALTAESSGYFDPPLLRHIVTEKKEVEEEVSQYNSEDYLSPEEQAELMLFGKEPERQAEQPMPQAPEFDDEELLMAQANLRISRRVERFMEERSKNPEEQVQEQPVAEHTEEKSVEAEKQEPVVQVTPEPMISREQEVVAEKIVEPVIEKAAEPVAEASVEQKITESVQEAAEKPVRETAGPDRETSESEGVHFMTFDEAKPVESDYETEDHEEQDAPETDSDEKEDSVESKAKKTNLKMAVQQQMEEANDDIVAQPDTPEDQKHVTADVDETSTGEALAREILAGIGDDSRKEPVSQNESEMLEDTALQEDAAGSDVSDERLQRKVNEQVAKKSAINAAVNTQQDIQEMREQTAKPEPEKTESVNPKPERLVEPDRPVRQREVPQEFLDLERRMTERTDNREMQ